MKPQSLYVSMDLFEDAEGVHTVDYTQWETSGAVRVYPVETYVNSQGETQIMPCEGHGGPLMSLMTRYDAIARFPALLAMLLRNLK
jgi:hypothetical protein